MYLSRCLHFADKHIFLETKYKVNVLYDLFLSAQSNMSIFDWLDLRESGGRALRLEARPAQKKTVLKKYATYTNITFVPESLGGYISG